MTENNILKIKHPNSLSKNARKICSTDKFRPKAINSDILNFHYELNPNIRYSERDDKLMSSSNSNQDSDYILNSESDAYKMRSPLTQTVSSTFFGSTKNGNNSPNGICHTSQNNNYGIYNSDDENKTEFGKYQLTIEAVLYDNLNRKTRGGRIEMNAQSKKKYNVTRINLIKPAKRGNNLPQISNPTSLKNRKFLIRLQNNWRKYLKYQKKRIYHAVNIQSFFRGYNLRKRVYKFLYLFFSIQRLTNKMRKFKNKYIINPIFNMFKNKFGEKHKQNFLNENAKKIQKFIQKCAEKVTLRRNVFVDSLQSLLNKKRRTNFRRLIDRMKSKYLSDKLIQNQKVI